MRAPELEPTTPVETAPKRRQLPCFVDLGTGLARTGLDAAELGLAELGRRPGPDHVATVLRTVRRVPVQLGDEVMMEKKGFERFQDLETRPCCKTA